MNRVSKLCCGVGGAASDGPSATASRPSEDVLYVRTIRTGRGPDAQIVASAVYQYVCMEGVTAAQAQMYALTPCPRSDDPLASSPQLRETVEGLGVRQPSRPSWDLDDTRTVSGLPYGAFKGEGYD